MSAPAAPAEGVLRCAGCGYTTAPGEPYPFRCAYAGSGDTDHVLVPLVPDVGFPRGGADNPFLRYRTLLHSYRAAVGHGMPDERYRRLVAGLDAAVASVAGCGFRVTPFQRAAGLSADLGFVAPGGVWVKDETGNVSGSHKGRHLMEVLIHLTVMAECGRLDPGARPILAIASCGNAALAAAVVARAGGWPLRVFVPTDADPGVVHRLRGLDADVVVCPRRPGTPGDPTYLRLVEALDGGALPFTTQGNLNGLAVSGGRTLGFELAGARPDLPGDLDHVILQVGGGALASSCAQGLRLAAGQGVLGRMPRIHAVQTCGAHPLARAYSRVRGLAGPPSGSPGVPDRPDPAAVRAAVAHAATHRSEFMRPWPTPPASVATGILDDETYDWRSIVEEMLMTGGRPVVVDDDLLREANRLAVAGTGIPVDPTGSAGLAGLLALRRSGVVAADDRVAVLFTGIRR